MIVTLIIVIISIIMYSKFTSKSIKQDEELPFTPFKYTIKHAKDQCPEGEKMTYFWNESKLMEENGCQPIAEDAGKMCAQNNDCVNNCIFYIQDLVNHCESYACIRVGFDCPKTVSCKGIRGRCEATKNESKFTLIKPGEALCSCGR